MAILKWIGRVVLALATLAVLCLLVVLVGSSRILNRTYDIPLTQITVPSDSLSIAKGERLAVTRGCISCHGSTHESTIQFDELLMESVTAPDLTHEVEEYTDAELARIIRHGVTPRGKSTIVMPSAMFYHLTDQDVGAILAYLRSLPKSNGPDEVVELRWRARAMLLSGAFKLPAEEIDHGASRTDYDPSNAIAFGNYLAKTACTQCHGLDLRGASTSGFDAPDLAIVGTYPDSTFRKLMHDGVALGDREVGVMSEVARSRFSHFTDEEVGALYAFLSRSDLYN